MSLPPELGRLGDVRTAHADGGHRFTGLPQFSIEHLTPEFSGSVTRGIPVSGERLFSEFADWRPKAAGTDEAPTVKFCRNLLLSIGAHLSLLGTQARAPPFHASLRRISVGIPEQASTSRIYISRTEEIWRERNAISRPTCTDDNLYGWNAPGRHHLVGRVFYLITRVFDLFTRLVGCTFVFRLPHRSPFWLYRRLDRSCLSRRL